MTHLHVPEGIEPHGDVAATLHHQAALAMERLRATVGDPAGAGHRLVAAAFHLRTADVGRQMMSALRQGGERRVHLRSAIDSTDQFIEEAGVVLCVASTTASLDMCAAALYRAVAMQPYDPDDPDREVDVEMNREWGKIDLPPPHREWLQSVRGDNRWNRLRLRHTLLHRQYPRHITVSPGSSSSVPLEVEGPDGREDVDDLLDDALPFAVERFVALCRLLSGNPDSPEPQMDG